MKRLIAAIAAGLFAAGASATNIYYGFQDGNPDLSGDRAGVDEMSGVQPGIGDGDRYQGWDDGNPDLFRTLPHEFTESDDPNIYEGFGRNPDIQF
ncbi:MAG: hypothetical protein U9Q81_13610 [Pseudomonadota bacterium]|nr:hypothetical protein [Pseudomonadota bacterium]